MLDNVDFPFGVCSSSTPRSFSLSRTYYVFIVMSSAVYVSAMQIDEA